MTTLVARARRFGAPLGEAFQLRDDLLGVVEGEADLGQPRPSWIRARAREVLDPPTFSRLEQAPADEVRSALRVAGVLDAAAGHANALVGDAVSVLDEATSTAGAGDALREIAMLVQVRP